MALKVHHLSAGTMCPRGRRLINGDGGYLEHARLCCHVLLLETAAGLVLIDTGFGVPDLSRPSRLPKAYQLQLAVHFDPVDAARSQIQSLGLDPEDVRHIVVTHLDPDHAGGLVDFPHATVHLHLREHDAAMARRSFIERQRYLHMHWSHPVSWMTHETVGEAWHGFSSARAIPELGDDLLLIPLHGHTHGHSGIAVHTSNGWLLHCGDAYFHHAELEAPGAGPGGLMLFERMIAMDDKVRRTNQARLRTLHQGGDVRLLCSHDPVELSRCQAESAGA